jgi:hypothetical protein
MDLAEMQEQHALAVFEGALASTHTVVLMGLMVKEWAWYAQMEKDFVVKVLA